MDRIKAIEPDDDEIDRDDKAQQPRNYQDQDAGNKSNKRRNVRIGDVHGCFLVSSQKSQWESVAGPAG